MTDPTSLLQCESRNKQQNPDTNDLNHASDPTVTLLATIPDISSIYNSQVSRKSLSRYSSWSGDDFGRALKNSDMLGLVPLTRTYSGGLNSPFTESSVTKVVSINDFKSLTSISQKLVVEEQECEPVASTPLSSDTLSSDFSSSEVSGTSSEDSDSEVSSSDREYTLEGDKATSTDIEASTEELATGLKTIAGIIAPECSQIQRGVLREELTVYGRSARAQSLNIGAAEVVLRSNAARIRRGYLDRLGIGLVNTCVDSDNEIGVHTRRAFLASAKARRKAPSLRSKLREPVQSNSGIGKSIIKKLASWMSPDDAQNSEKVGYVVVNDSATLESRAVVCKATYRKALRIKTQKEQHLKKSVAFLDETEIYFVPSRTDISPRYKARLWHTREEFIEMVMRNMDQVEEELREKAELQRRLEDIKNNPPPSLRIKRTQA